MKIKCIIIDDQEFAINEIRKVILELSNEFPMDIVKTFTNPLQAINEINEIDFDLMFIDYEMKPYNGVEIVKHLKKEVTIIFVTSHSNISGNITNEVDYKGFITKPPEVKLLRQIFKNKKIGIINPRNKDEITIPNGVGKLYYKNDEILYIESSGGLKKIVTKYITHLDKDGKPIEKQNSDFMLAHPNILNSIEISFNKLEKILPYNDFVLISKKHMVNMKHVRKKTKTKFILKNKIELPIGESKRAALNDRFKV